MNKQAIAEFTLEDGTKAYFEVPEPDAGDAVENVALGEEVYRVAAGAAGTFEQALDIDQFYQQHESGQGDRATDQLLNAVYLITQQEEWTPGQPFVL
jgi:hypothetical protein